MAANHYKRGEVFWGLLTISPWKPQNVDEIEGATSEC